MAIAFFIQARSSRWRNNRVQHRAPGRQYFPDRAAAAPAKVQPLAGVSSHAIDGSIHFQVEGSKPCVCCNNPGLSGHATFPTPFASWLQSSARQT
jgi:hypothetical protein